jgi:hypothetical protein
MLVEYFSEAGNRAFIEEARRIPAPPLLELKTPRHKLARCCQITRCGPGPHARREVSTTKQRGQVDIYSFVLIVCWSIRKVILLLYRYFGRPVEYIMSTTSPQARCSGDERCQWIWCARGRCSGNLSDSDQSPRNSRSPSTHYSGHSSPHREAPVFAGRTTAREQTTTGLTTIGCSRTQENSNNAAPTGNS